MTDSPTGVSLETLLQALGATVATAVVTPAGPEVAIGSVVLLEDADLGASETIGDLALLIGVSAPQAEAWLARLSTVDAALRPRAVATKRLSADLRAGAERAGVALIAVHPQARTELVLATVRSLLEGGAGQSVTGDRADEPLAGENDLYGLAQTVAALTGGLVSIEDDRSQLLAYSATDGAADELRMLSILGRAGPADYLRRLRERGCSTGCGPSRESWRCPPMISSAGVGVSSSTSDHSAAARSRAGPVRGRLSARSGSRKAVSRSTRTPGPCWRVPPRSPPD